MDALTAVSLSAIAYESDIPAALARQLPSWQAEWLADRPVDDNMAFIARSGDAEYAVAIRGTLMQFQAQNVENWIEDLDVMRQVSWPPGDAESKLSHGAHTGLDGLQRIVDSRSGSTVSMRDFLLARAKNSPIRIAVIGHSLGGTLATVLASWLHDEFTGAGVDASFSVWTFAAPAAGNAHFASRYDEVFASTSFRFVMEFDVVPTFPLPHEMISMTRTYFDGVDHDEFCRLTDLALQGCARGIEASEFVHGSHYAHTNEREGCIRVEVDGVAKPPVSTVSAWLQAVASRHSVDRYVQAVAALPPNEHVTP